MASSHTYRTIDTLNGEYITTSDGTPVVVLSDSASVARLIAAAPELLAALEDCVARLGRDVPAGAVALIRRIKN